MPRNTTKKITKQHGYGTSNKPPGGCVKCDPSREKAVRHARGDCSAIPGGCIKCDPFGEETVRHRPKDCHAIPFCPNHGTWDHAYTDRCARTCYHCQKDGHIMLYCRKLKDCVLCGKSGHNPLRCWRYCTISQWMFRAEQLSRCGECLTLFTTDEKWCSNCRVGRGYWKPYQWSHQETQTEEDSSIVQEYQTELQEKQSTIEDQRIQIEELNNKISSLENKLESSITAINELNWQLQNTVKEKERELQRIDILDLVCRQKETELRRLQQQMCQKDFELEQHKKTSAQPSQTIPATAQQPNLVITFNNSGDSLETSHIKATLIDIQNQQQKLSMVVNHLYNKIKTQDMYWINHSSFNPYLGPYDTGQYFNKLQQVY